MKELINLLSRFLLEDLSPLSKPKGPFYMRLIANLGAFFFLIFGCVLGCRALYHYLEPIWGEVYSLLALCVLLLVTSFLFFTVGWFLKPKASPATDFILSIQKIASEMPENEFIKKIISKVSAKTLVAVFTIVAMTSYLANFKKKNT